MDRVIKAQVAEVSLGQVKFEGLRSESNEYGVAVTQVAKLFSFLIHNAQRDFKALLNKETPFLMWKTPLNSKKVAVLTLKEFRKLIRALDKKDNILATAIMDALLDVSLEELFNDAFGIVNTPETRQQYIEKSLLSLREELTLVHGGFQAKCINLNFCARHIHDYATKKLVGRTAKESIQELPINPEFTDYEKYSRYFIGINHVNDDEIKFLESLVKFKKLFSNKRPKHNEDWRDYTDRVLSFV